MPGAGRRRSWRQRARSVALHDVRRKRVDGGRVVDERAAVETDADVVVYQRLVSRDVVDTIPHRRPPVSRWWSTSTTTSTPSRRGTLPGRHVTGPAAAPPRRRLRRRPRREEPAVAREACRQADLVTVSTPALAKRYARHGRVAVLELRPQLLPRHHGPGPRGVRVGWTGKASPPTSTTSRCAAAGSAGAPRRRHDVGRRHRCRGPLPAAPRRRTARHELGGPPPITPPSTPASTSPWSPPGERLQRGEVVAEGAGGGGGGVLPVASPTAPYRAPRRRGAGTPATSPMRGPHRHPPRARARPAADLAGRGREVAAGGRSTVTLTAGRRGSRRSQQAAQEGAGGDVNRAQRRRAFRHRKHPSDLSGGRARRSWRARCRSRTPG